jgi:hypothetical protein
MSSKDIECAGHVGPGGRRLGSCANRCQARAGHQQRESRHKTADNEAAALSCCGALGLPTRRLARTRQLIPALLVSAGLLGPAAQGADVLPANRSGSGGLSLLPREGEPIPERALILSSPYDLSGLVGASLLAKRLEGAGVRDVQFHAVSPRAFGNNAGWRNPPEVTKGDLVVALGGPLAADQVSNLRSAGASVRVLSATETDLSEYAQLLRADSKQRGRRRIETRTLLVDPARPLVRQVQQALSDGPLLDARHELVSLAEARERWSFGNREAQALVQAVTDRTVDAYAQRLSTGNHAQRQQAWTELRQQMRVLEQQLRDDGRARQSLAAQGEQTLGAIERDIGAMLDPRAPAPHGTRFLFSKVPAHRAPGTTEGPVDLVIPTLQVSEPKTISAVGHALAERTPPAYPAVGVMTAFGGRSPTLNLYLLSNPKNEPGAFDLVRQVLEPHGGRGNGAFGVLRAMAGSPADLALGREQAIRLAGVSTGRYLPQAVSNTTAARRRADRAPTAAYRPRR